MRRAALGLPLLLLVGCRVVGPDWRPPEMEMPESWSGSGRKQPTLAAWWTNFDDPVLASLVERAIDANLDLDQAQARIRQARAALVVAEGGLFPTANVSGDYRRFRGA